MIIRSLIAEHSRTVDLNTDLEEAQPFNVRVLHPTRTLVEKLMILHHASTTGDRDERIRLARHYYDVWCLLNHQPTLDGFEQWPCDALAREVQAHTEHAGLQTSARPSTGFASSPAFTEPTRAVHKAFNDQVLGQLVWGPADNKPSLADCYGSLHDDGGALARD